MASHHIMYEQPWQGSEEEKREFTYDHKYAGNDTFQLLSKVLKTVVTFFNCTSLPWFEPLGRLFYDF